MQGLPVFLGMKFFAKYSCLTFYPPKNRHIIIFLLLKQNCTRTPTQMLPIETRSVTLCSDSCNLSRSGHPKGLVRINNWTQIVPRGDTLGDVQKNHCSVAPILVKSKIEFYFLQWFQQQKNCETRPLQGLLQKAIIQSTCNLSLSQQNCETSCMKCCQV